jgi:hypothetical protein
MGLDELAAIRADLAILTERLDGIRELLLALREEDGKALRHQFDEYQRRLLELNNAHERAEKAQAISVSQEKFDDHAKQAEATRVAAEKTFAARLDELKADIGNVMTEQVAQRARSAANLVAVGIVFSIVTIAMTVLTLMTR